MITFNNGWDEFLQDDFSSDNYKNLRSFLKNEYLSQTVYPSMYDIFNCFKVTALDDVKVVILGQDPYHGQGQAMGLSFSVPKGIAVPPSLQNIYKELESDLSIPRPAHGDLTSWAKQGVLLLNAVLTVRANTPNSHKDKGWETFTDSVIKKLSDKKDGLVFILWGNNARQKKSLIDGQKHLILESPHPSPFSAYSGFFGCKHFSKTNAYLLSKNKPIINWKI